MPTTKQPAKTTTKKQPAKKEPAVKVEKTDTSISLQDLAKKLGRNEKSLRAQIRRINGGPVVGRGKRYAWKSFNDPALKALMAKLQEKKTTAQDDATEA